MENVLGNIGKRRGRERIDGRLVYKEGNRNLGK